MLNVIYIFGHVSIQHINPWWQQQKSPFIHFKVYLIKIKSLSFHRSRRETENNANKQTNRDLLLSWEIGKNLALIKFQHLALVLDFSFLVSREHYLFMCLYLQLYLKSNWVRASNPLVFISNLENSLCTLQTRTSPPWNKEAHKAACIFTAEHRSLLHIHQPLHPQVRLIIPSPASLSWGACCQFIRLFLLISDFPQRRHPSHAVRGGVRGLRAKRSGSADRQELVGMED